MELIDTTATVHTPERVRFRYRLAGPGQRAAAWMIDLLAQAAILFAISLLATLLDVAAGGFGTGLFLLGLFVVQWLYGAILETAFSGRTPGKMVLSLRVVRVDGAPAQMPDFLLRNLLRAADALPLLFGVLPTFGVGALVMLAGRQQRRLGDLVSGTVVVAEDKAHMLGTVALDPPVTEEERQSLPPAVRLSNEELQVIEAFLRRRRRLSDERAEELARFFAPTVTEREGVEAPTAERVLALAYARATGRDRDSAPDLVDGAAGVEAVDGGGRS